ncbi:MAG: TolC family protein [Candidatus Hydrogenedentes bacterium]|nr:TolC family protein [Candidatus Hydrogenedentota bacterium]
MMHRLLLTAGLALALPALGQGLDASTAGQEVERMMGSVSDVLEGVETYTPPAAEAPAAEPAALTVEDCVARALAENAQALIAAEDVIQKRAQLAQAKALGRPQIQARGSFIYIDGLPTNVYDPGIFGFITGFNEDDLEMKKWLVEGDVVVQQVLYAGGRIHAAVEAAKSLVEAQEWQRQVQLSELEYQTRQAYYDYLLAQALVEVAKESVGTFKRHGTDAESKLEAGIASGFEVLRADTELGNRAANLEEAQTAVQLARMNLLRLIGLPLDTPLELAGKLSWEPVEATPESLLPVAFEQRPELKAIEAGIVAAERQVDEKRSQYKPNAAAVVGLNEIEGGPAVVPEGLNVGIIAQWEIYSGGRRKGEVAEAQSQVRSLEYQQTDLLRLVELDVRQAYARVQEAIAKIKSEKGTVALAEEGQRLAELRFTEGVGTQSDILDASLALSQARTGLVQALRDYAVARAALKKAIGEGVYTEAASEVTDEPDQSDRSETSQ